MTPEIYAELRELLGRWLSLPLSAHQRIAEVDLPTRQHIDNLFVLIDQADPQWYTDWCRTHLYDPSAGLLEPAPTGVRPFMAAMASPTLGHKWKEGIRGLEALTSLRNELQAGDKSPGRAP